MANSLGYTTGSIAGVQLAYLGDDAKVTILDGGNLVMNVPAVNFHSADGTLVQQVYSQSFVGSTFGVQFEFFPISVLKDVIAAVVQAIVDGTTFLVSLKDDFYDLNLLCTWDYAAAPKGLSIASQRVDATYLKDIVLRFIVAEEASS